MPWIPGHMKGDRFDMKRIIALLLAASLCLCLLACDKIPESEQAYTEATDTEGIENVKQNIVLVGPWHLDSEKNDLAAFADSLELFPGYGEWGASMEIRSNGQMSWYIGAEGWHGTYTVEDGVLRAQLTSDSEQTTQSWDFRIMEENASAVLQMDYQDMTIFWVYGDREDPPAMGVDTKVYVDRQGTTEIYSSLSITQSDNGYVIEMEIYRMGYFQGTAVETQGRLVYTGDFVGVKGRSEYSLDQGIV